MNKSVFVPAYFEELEKYVTEKVPTGRTKKILGFIPVAETRTKGEYVHDGYSDKFINGERLAEDINKATKELNDEGYEVVSVMPVTSGNYDWRYEIKNIGGNGGGGGYGYGYGYSFTSSVIITARKVKE